jgi:hypothetical protein
MFRIWLGWNSFKGAPNPLGNCMRLLYIACELMVPHGAESVKEGGPRRSAGANEACGAKEEAASWMPAASRSEVVSMQLN